MFKLSEKHEVDRRNLKCDYKRYTPSEPSTIDTAKSQMFINIPEEGTVLSMLNGYLHVLYSANPDNRYADDVDIQKVSLGPIALVSNYKLTTGSGKHLENFSHAHLVSLMCKLLISPKHSVDLSTGFDQDRNRRQRELNINKNIEANYHIRKYSKEFFGFAEHQEKVFLLSVTN